MYVKLLINERRRVKRRFATNPVIFGALCLIGGGDRSKYYSLLFSSLSDILSSYFTLDSDRGKQTKGSLAMPRRKEDDEYAELGEKDCWHSYGLQVLSPSKFSSVVGKILTGKYTLIVARLDRSVASRVN